MLQTREDLRQLEQDDRLQNSQEAKQVGSYSIPTLLVV